MDISTIIGYILGFSCILGFILMEGSVTLFWYIPAMMIVFGGVTAAMFIKYPLDEVKRLLPTLKKCFFYREGDIIETIHEIRKLAETARRESIFALEKVPLEDPFMKKAIGLAADNRPPEVINSILTLEIEAMQERHATGAEMTENMGADAPGFGMLGTLLGLVLLLSNLSDPSAIGPGMATALLTTTYGSFLANVCMLPLTNKLKIRSKQESLRMNIIVVGTLGIVAGENPRVIHDKLMSFLPASKRVAIDAGEGAKEKQA